MGGDCQSSAPPCSDEGPGTQEIYRTFTSQWRLRLQRGNGRGVLMYCLRMPTKLIARSKIPLNQEDMAATLGAFGVAPVWSLERMGFRLSIREKEAYLFLWRYLGYYLGSWQSGSRSAIAC
jgi:hypothetical protein